MLHRPIDWRLIRAADRPIPEDDWIDSVFPTETQRRRWRAWLARPRFAVAVDVGLWAAIAVAFQESAGDNALLELFRNIDAQPRANAWAVCKASGQIYRLAMHLPPEAAVSADTVPTTAAGAEGAVFIEANAAPPVAHPFRTIAPEAWQDPALRGRWEAHLRVADHWVLSECHRRLMRVGCAGEFAVWRSTDQLSYVDALFEGVMAIETLPTLRRRHLHARLYRRERILATATTTALLAKIDAPWLRQLQQARIPGGLSAVSLNWLASATGSAVGIVSTEQQARRLQALIAAPLLVPWLLGDRRPMRLGLIDGYGDRVPDPNPDSETAFPHRAVAISNAVDTGAPLYPLLARLTGLSMRTVRHLRLSELRIHHLVDRVDHYANDQVVSRLRWLDIIPVGQWPHTSTAWLLWANVIKALCSQCDLLTELIAQPVRPAFGRGAIALGFYTSLAARRWRLRLGPAYDPPGGDSSAEALLFVGMDLRDFVRALRTVAIDEFDDLGEPTRLSLPPAVSDLFRDWQLEDWWAASSRWHAALTAAGIPIEAHGEPSRTEHVTLPWLALLAEPLRSEGEHGDVRVVRFLESGDALKQEADAMRHCIGTYARRCVTGRWHIASLVDGAGVHCSTAAFQLRFEQGRWVAALVEHRGPNNAKPSMPCAHAIRALEMALSQPGMQSRYVEIEAVRVARAAARREHRDQGDARGHDVSLAALPVNVYAALVGERR